LVVLNPTIIRSRPRQLRHDKELKHVENEVEHLYNLALILWLFEMLHMSLRNLRGHQHVKIMSWC